jgi:hypothetical protein
MEVEPEDRLAGMSARDDIRSAPMRRAARHTPQMLGHVDALPVEAERCDGALHQSCEGIISRTGWEGRVDRHHPREIVDSLFGGSLDFGETIDECRAR